VEQAGQGVANEQDVGSFSKGVSLMEQKPVDAVPVGGDAAPQEFQDAVQAADRARLEAILDKAAADAGWKQQLLDDPEAAMAGIDQSGPLEIGEVAGQSDNRTKWVWRWYLQSGWAWFHWPS
jgi:hypothetical protein